MCLDITEVDDAGNVVAHYPGGLRLDVLRRELARMDEMPAEEARRMAKALERELQAAQRRAERGR